MKLEIIKETKINGAISYTVEKDGKYVSDSAALSKEDVLEHFELIKKGVVLKREVIKSEVILSGEAKTYKHLRYDCLTNYKGHPQEVMKELGITYQMATPQSMTDEWWFWNCENIPNPLPDFLYEFKLDPVKAIGRGLNKEDADMIINYNGK